VLWWQHEKNRAIRQGDWKLVAAGRESAWELYNLREDRTETMNVADQNPEIVERLSMQWETMRANHQAVALQRD
jgi:arylsulfatase